MPLLLQNMQMLIKYNLLPKELEFEIISLSSTNIIDKATEAVDKSNLQEVQELATLIWAEAYLDEVENIDKTSLCI